MTSFERFTTPADVPVINIVTGVSRVGKTETAKAYAKRLPGATVLSLDMDFRADLWGNPELEAKARLDLEADTQSPELDLFLHRLWGEQHIDDEDWIRSVLEQTQPATFPRRQDSQFSAVWKLSNVVERILDVATKPDQMGAPLLESGIPLKHIAELRDENPGLHVREVVLVNENPDHVTKALEAVEQARSSGNPDSNWMAGRNWSNRKITAYMEQLREHSALFVEQAGPDNYDVLTYDMGRGDFLTNVARVTGYLTGELSDIALVQPPQQTPYPSAPNKAFRTHSATKS